MAARKPPGPKKKPPAPKKAVPKASALGNDPFARGAAVREISLNAPPGPREPARPVTPELQVQGQGVGKPVRRSPVLEPLGEKPKSGSGMPPPPPAATRKLTPSPRGGEVPVPSQSRDRGEGGPTAHSASPSVAADPRSHADAPTGRTISGPTAHSASPSVAADPRSHADAPTGHSISGPTPHSASPSVAADPRSHSEAPTGRSISGPTPHSASPSSAADPRSHADAPTGRTISGPTSHSASPSSAADPRAHAGAPTAQTLSGSISHAGSPSISVDPRPHAGAPTGRTIDGPTSHASSPSVTLVEKKSATASSALSPTLSPAGEREHGLATMGGALRGLLNAVRTSAGLASRTTEVDRWGKDSALTASLRPLASLLYEKYWRVRVEGADQLPTGPCIIVANHAGALPLDGPVLHLALRRERPELEESRWLLEDQIFHAPFVGVLANRLGAVRANPENAMRLLQEGRPVIVFPEGFHGLSKPFSERYQLRRFGRGGYVKIALRAGVPIVPAAIIGGEESMPLLGKIPGGLFGVEYLPITLPPLPARWHLRFAAPISLEGAPAEPEHDLAWVERKNLAVRDQVEAMLTDMLQHRERIF